MALEAPTRWSPPRTGRTRLAALLAAAALASALACSTGSTPPAADGEPVRPVAVTEPVGTDSDDPAIWLHPTDPARSLILGTDKGGALYAFDLAGRAIPERTVSGQARLNNVDVEYGVELGGALVDIAVATDRDAGLLRAFALPDMRPIDGGGLPVFEGEPPPRRRPMGIGLYKRPSDGAVFAIVSRKEGPSGAYLWQYRLVDDGSGLLGLVKVRELGLFSGSGEIEAVAVDDELGFVFCSDERAGVRKYAADPDAPDAGAELALFGTDGFAEDREGISIYDAGLGTGYILVSDQAAGAFHVFRREGEPGRPHDHRRLAVIPVSTRDSDGSEVTSADLGPRYPGGLFVAMSDDRTFQLYAWEDLARRIAGQAP